MQALAKSKRKITEQRQRLNLWLATPFWQRATQTNSRQNKTILCYNHTKMQILGQKMSAKDEAKTRRIDIDTLLQECGFILQDKSFV